MSRVDDILYSPIPAPEPAPEPDQNTVIVILDCNPLYECTAQCFLAGRLLSRGARIIWNETPNRAMKPLNDAAKERYARFIARVGAPV